MNVNRIVVYIFIMLIYLGLSKSFSPSEFGINYVLNDQSLSKMIKGAPVTVILTDMHSTGFLIKTYYHKYKVVYGFQSVEELIVRTSGQFTSKHKKHLGLSIFRRYEQDLREEFTALPPGSMFIDDRSFGQWVNDNSGDKVWRFYRPYRNIPQYLGWGKFKATEDFAQKIKMHMSQKKPFFGLKNEFGLEGPVTKESFPSFFSRQKPKDINFKQFILDYFKENF
jgi:hypothetical protein